MFIKKIRVSEGIILKFVLSEEWDLILKHRASEIRVKRIRVNQGLGVQTFKLQTGHSISYKYVSQF